MLMRRLGRSGLRVSALCLGGNTFGWTTDQKASDAVLDAYVEAGGNFIDTADVYSRWVPGNSGGESETENVDIVSKSQATKVDLLDLDRALDALHREDRSLARLIEMKYFGGMSAEETAEALGQSIHAVRSDLHFAEAWLRQRLTS